MATATAKRRLYRPTKVNMRRCPHCGADGDWVQSYEVLSGAGGVILTEDGDGRIVHADWAGGTEVFWDGSETMHFECESCNEPLPLAYEQELQRLFSGDHAVDPTYVPKTTKAQQYQAAVKELEDAARALIEEMRGLPPFPGEARLVEALETVTRERRLDS